jgi:nucleoside-diphosphate-sugar epimerase
MRVFVTGATGAIGSRLVPQLIERGHEVIGAHKSTGGAEQLRALGAEPLQLDLLDRDAVGRAVVARRLDAIVDQATAIPAVIDSQGFAAVYRGDPPAGARADASSEQATRSPA